MNANYGTFRYFKYLVLFCIANIVMLKAQLNFEKHFYRALDSGGPIIREQAAYDVLYYRLNLSIDTTTRSIRADLFSRSLVMDTISTYVLDLSSHFIVDSVKWQGYQANNKALPFSQHSDRLWIILPSVQQKEDTIFVTVWYHGVPKVASNPPWESGFVWKYTKTGEIWAGVACEAEGADMWWPCKDHPSDEPDSVDLYFTVPASLTCVSNGRLLEEIVRGSSKTLHWNVSEPISNYAITFYLGPYQKIPITYQSVTGEMIPSEYWFLPYNVEKAKQYSTTFLKDLRFFEEVCGPYPFRSEKYGLADAPYYGMEHQTIIAYGNNFRLNSYGFDYIHLHELAHEWWGNLVTAKDWSDVWIHEGFATYMEALFVERTLGVTKYKNYMFDLSRQILNTKPVAPLEATTAAKMFSSNDIYFKGAWILHTLRHYLGDKTFFDLYRKIAYPDSVMETLTDGKQCRYATTDDILRLAEQHTGLTLDWFFAVYLRQAKVPELQYSKVDTMLTLQWVTPNNVPFSLPVDVQIGADTLRVNMTNGIGHITIPAGASYKIDPDAWVLMKLTQIMSVPDEMIPLEFGMDNYPNPFNPSTTISYQLPERCRVSLKIYDVTGRELETLVDEDMDVGRYTMTWNASSFSTGTYFAKMSAGKYSAVKKLALVK